MVVSRREREAPTDIDRLEAAACQGTASTAAGLDRPDPRPSGPSPPASPEPPPSPGEMTITDPPEAPSPRSASTTYPTTVTPPSSPSSPRHFPIWQPGAWSSRRRSAIGLPKPHQLPCPLRCAFTVVVTQRAEGATGRGKRRAGSGSRGAAAAAGSSAGGRAAPAVGVGRDGCGRSGRRGGRGRPPGCRRRAHTRCTGLPLASLARDRVRPSSRHQSSAATARS